MEKTPKPIVEGSAGDFDISWKWV